MRITQLRSFYGVATTGSFTAAARAANVSQPTVTAQVRELEEDYRVQLFLRRGRKVRLTEEGAGLLEIAARLFDQEQQAIQYLRDSKQLRTGHLRVSAVGPSYATDMLLAFHARYPDIRVTVTNHNSHESLASLKNYLSDVAVHSYKSYDPMLETVEFSRHRILIFVHRRHRFYGAPSIRIEDLEGERFIMREQGSMTRALLEDALRAARVQPKVVMEIGTREAVREAVANGLGIGAVSEEQFLPGENLWAMPIANAHIYNTTHVSTLRDRAKSRLVGAFMDVVSELRARTA